jgi:hypothetical protein
VVQILRDEVMFQRPSIADHSSIRLPRDRRKR